MADPNTRVLREHPMFVQLVAETSASGTKRYRMLLLERDDEKKGYGFVSSPEHRHLLPGIKDFFDDLERDFASRRKVPVLVSGVVTSQMRAFRGRLRSMSTLMITALRLDDGIVIPDFN